MSCHKVMLDILCNKIKQNQSCLQYSARVLSSDLKNELVYTDDVDSITSMIGRTECRQFNVDHATGHFIAWSSFVVRNQLISHNILTATETIDV